MKSLRPLFFSFAVLASLQGCALENIYPTRSVEITVLHDETGAPAANVMVSVDYRRAETAGPKPPLPVPTLPVPESVSAQTDDQGTVLLPIADFQGHIDLAVNSQRYHVTRALVRKGGVAPGEPRSALSRTGQLVTIPPAYLVKLTPER